MRALVFATAVLAVLYGGYWFVGSSQVEARTRGALAELEARGWDISYSDLGIRGFPSRFDTTLTDISMRSPSGDLVWESPFVQLLALSYRPNRVILVWPPEQRFRWQGQDVSLVADGLRASAGVGLALDLPLESATVESGPMELTADAGGTLSLECLIAAIRDAGPDLASYDVFLDAQGVEAAGLRPGLDTARLDAEIELAAPLDRRAAAVPALRRLDLRELRLALGEVAVTARGELAPDGQGYLTGTLTLSAENWRGLLRLLEEAGLLIHDQRAVLESALAELARGEERIEVPVTLSNGQVEALGVVLLQAPRVL